MVGCAMSHIKLCVDLLKSDLDMICVLEDDVTFSSTFKEQMKHLIQNLPADWDLIYLGHHLYPQYTNNDAYKNEALPPRLEKWNYKTSRQKSMGGTHGYMISKDGARKLLEFINNTGMTNGIDTVQQKAINVMNTYYCFPHLVFSECALPGQTVDSDIQYNYTSLSLPDYKDSVARDEYPDRLKNDGVFNIDDALVYVDLKSKFKFYPNLDQIDNDCYRHQENIELCMIRALNDDKCVAFNTLGFFKAKIDELKPSPYFKSNDGIYVKVSAKI